MRTDPVLHRKDGVKTLSIMIKTPCISPRKEVIHGVLLFSVLRCSVLSKNVNISCKIIKIISLHELCVNGML